ncbi:IclR family transcriptional regulator [Arthrobacter sp. zg-Y20]|uniref:IclR family transcriptional regulator n=1 Tax=unclassified Arthrobacter TaxID=235627 RepID=UPI001D13ABA6|nr:MULTISPECIES: IclR family transcriptional regulator [unclassified Arthrobacter]MCC3274532.1 IclR family transcriptional regulator [Arthrobacter sp. zg-Y20]MDK1314689.1 IclR family transcriptional regulator [Arthrobacter sp. zg.Y20]WIB07669.1 IclR family transcriptional regulator [Arthrobacter sp. zg-Y20]
MPEALPGGQVVARVAAILRALSSSPVGLSTGTVAAAVGLTRSTAYRILRSLAAEGYVDFDEDDSRWVLGTELLVMGTVAAARHDITELALPFVRRLAALTGESAFFSIRRGDETVCLLREEGTFPVRSFVLYEGVRFPLGIASAGLAILAFSDSEDVDAYFRRNSHMERRGYNGHSEAEIRCRMLRTRQLGFAVNPGLIVEGSFGMGAAVFDSAGRAQYSLSITGIEQRFGPGRVPALGRMLLDEAHQLTRRLAVVNPGRAQS